MSRPMIINREYYKYLLRAPAGASIITFVHSHTSPNGTADVYAGGDSRSIKCKVKVIPLESTFKADRGGRKNKNRIKVQLTKK